VQFLGDGRGGKPSGHPVFGQFRRKYSNERLRKCGLRCAVAPNTGAMLNWAAYFAAMEPHPAGSIASYFRALSLLAWTFQNFLP
jgi:hypothetical protein